MKGRHADWRFGGFGDVKLCLLPPESGVRRFNRTKKRVRGNLSVKKKPGKDCKTQGQSLGAAARTTGSSHLAQSVVLASHSWADSE